AAIVHVLKAPHGGVRPSVAGPDDLMVGRRRRGLGPRLAAKRRNAVEQNRQQHDRPPFVEHHYARVGGEANLFATGRGAGPSSLAWTQTPRRAHGGGPARRLISLCR